MPNLDYYKSLLDELDNLDTEVSKWEAQFLESLLSQVDNVGFTLSSRQEAILERMKEKYLA